MSSKKSILRFLGVLCVALLALSAGPEVLAGKGDKGPKGGGGGGNGGGNGGGDGRLSPASLDVDTCGCPTTFSDPRCAEQTEWEIDKTSLVDSVTGNFSGPLFEVVVTEGQTRQYLIGSGQLIVSNSGGQSTFLSSLVLNLQDSYADVPGFGGSEKGSRKCSDGRDNDRDGLVDDADPDCAPSNWFTLASALVNEQGTQCADQANTCEGTFFNAANSSIVLFDENRQEITSLLGDLEIAPDVDNDGDGQINEDPPYIEGVCFGIYDNDKDGLIDEDPGSLDNDGDGLIDEDCDDDDRDGRVNEDPPGGLDDDGDGAIDEDPIDGIDNDGDGDEGGFGLGTCADGLDNDGDGAVDCDDSDCAPSCDEDDPDDDRDGSVDEDGQAMDDDGDGAADEDCNGMWDDWSIEGDGQDNDGDGLFDEDGPDDDGDGKLDEDSGCDDTTIMWFEYRLDVTGLGLATGDGILGNDDDLRVELLATFKAGGERGGICAVDVNCNGVQDEGEDTVRTVQQRHQFDMPDCAASCPPTVVDAGAYAVDSTCVDVVSDSLDQVIAVTGVEGTQTVLTLDGTVTCVGGDCDTVITNVAELDFNPIDRIQPAVDALQGADGVTVKVQRTGSASYFRTTISGAGELSGVYEGWCVDNGNFITPNRTYCAELVSSYEALDGLTVDRPENMDLVNWVINQDYVGRQSPWGTYTFCDVQTAIWILVDDQGASTCGSRNQARWENIIAEAQAAGEGFEPGCDENVGLALRIVDCTTFEPVSVQATIIDIPMGGVTGIPGVCDCEDGEIAPGEAMASFGVDCNPLLPGTAIQPGDFCSQTQGGWGSTCNGSNTGCLRDLYFASVFPTGLVVGDQDGPFDGDQDWAFRLSSSEQVRLYLSINGGGSKDPLTADSEGPTLTPLGTFGNQLVAATLNVGFDDAGVGKCDLDPEIDCTDRFPVGYLRLLSFQDGCVHPDLVGRTVNDVLGWAHAYAATGELPFGATFSVSDLNDALAVVNQEFVDCQSVAGCLGPS